MVWKRNIIERAREWEVVRRREEQVCAEKLANECEFKEAEEEEEKKAKRKRVRAKRNESKRREVQK